MDDERHSGVVSPRDLEEIVIRVLNTTTIKELRGLTRLQVTIEMRAPIHGLSRTIKGQANH